MSSGLVAGVCAASVAPKRHGAEQRGRETRHENPPGRASDAAGSYLIGEKSAGSANTEIDLVDSGPSFSESALAFTHSGSALNAAQFFSASSRLGCART